MKSFLMVTYQKKNSQIIHADGDIHHFHFSIMGDSGLNICRKVSAGLQEEQDERTEVLSISTQLQAVETLNTVVSKSFSTERVSGGVSGLWPMIFHVHSSFHSSAVFTLK